MGSKETEINCLESVKNAIKKGDVKFKLHGHDKIISAIFEAKPNPNPNFFPDFLFKGGFIEHFQVTSSLDKARKGSSLRAREAMFDRKCEADFSNLEKELEKEDRFSYLTKNHKMIFDEGSYENYLQSFKKNWENHISNLKKYDGEKGIGIFMIENHGPTFKQMMNGKYTGNLYLLGVDKILLEYIFTFKQLVSFVIFRNSQYVEIIEIDLIPEMITEIPEGLAFEPGRHIKTSIKLGFIFDC